MTGPTVRNLRDGPVPPGALRVDRRTDWGNPFAMARQADRDDVCARFHDWFHTHPDAAPLRARIGELTGKDLHCWCAPRRCHADTLLAAANPGVPVPVVQRRLL